VPLSYRNTALAIVAGAALIACALPAAAAPYTFAGSTFLQESTPDVLGLLGNGANLGGAQFSQGNVTAVTRSVGFNSVSGNANSGFVGAAGFDPSLSLGRQAIAQQGLAQPDGTGCLFACAINTPLNNAGGSLRHGIEVSWSGGRTLANGAGGDFVLYESGSNAASPEHMIVRVRLTDGTFSAWRFETSDGFQVYTTTPTATVEGAFATVYDLDSFGLGAGDEIDMIQFATILTADRWNSATGNFAFDGSGTIFSASGGPLDADPLYVGVLRGLNGGTAVPGPAGVGLLALGLGLLAAAARRRR
jgi:hypothetical protein